MSERATGPDGIRDGEEVSALLATLADEHRRQVVRYFQTDGNTVASVDDLVEHVAGWEVSASDRERLAVTLHHVTLPRLDAAGVVEYDARSHTARYREAPSLERLLTLATEIEEAA